VWVVACTDTRDPWVTKQAKATAMAVLSQQLPHLTRREFIVYTVMEGLLRPLFSTSKSSRLTAAGRQAHHDASPSAVDLATTNGRPWKGKQSHSLTVFDWAVEQSDVSNR
jgi:hypothetical protein